jgi:dipeptidase
MCDTLMLLRPGEAWLAKNSDREPDEPQRVEWHEAGQSGGDTQQTTYIPVTIPAQKHAAWLSRPSWMWGAEMGVNEKGVAIANEAVFTRLINRKTPGLLGMDLLRLALEQSNCADEALTVITGYLEEYGQGGPGGYRDKKFFYDNSFLIADAQSGWQLETAGRFWVARKYCRENGRLSVAISNGLTISSDFDSSSANIEDRCIRAGYWSGKGDFDFTDTFATWFMPWAGRAKQRRHCNLSALTRISDDRPIEEQLSASLRQHTKGNWHSSNADVCMHADGRLRPSQTTQSMISKLSVKQSQVWMTGGSAPCISLFKPLFQPTTHSGPRNWLTEQSSFWEQWQKIYQKAEASPDTRDRIRAINAGYEQQLWQADMATASNLLAQWWQGVQLA